MPTKTKRINRAAILECGDCGVAYILRLFMRFTVDKDPYVFAYMPDCKHNGKGRFKKNAVVRYDEAGEVIRAEVASSE